MNIAYTTAQGISNNLTNSFQQGNDERKIEEILSQVKSTEDPKVVNDFIGKLISQVSPERRGDAIQYLQYVNQNLEKKEQESKIKAKETKIESEERLAAEQGGYTYGAPPAVQTQQVKNSYESKNKQKVGKTIKDSLIKAGYPEETANLWDSQFQAAPVGGQSDVIKQVNDLIKRSSTGKGTSSDLEINVLKPSIDIPGLPSQTLQLDFPELKQVSGRTSSDMVKEESEHKKINTPLYSETIDRLNALDEEYRDIQHLQELNETPGALPEGIEKWNVDWESGDLRIKALATPEMQDYVKTIARMARKAKDFFPGRVTNFDLEQFKLGFPTLANSPEGRKIIAEQITISNRIAYLKDETLKAAIDHYGSGADPAQVRKYAQENYRKYKSELEKELKQVNEKAKQIIKSNPETKNIQEAKTLEDLF